jgi:hypothetical protein
VPSRRRSRAARIDRRAITTASLDARMPETDAADFDTISLPAPAIEAFLFALVHDSDGDIEPTP